MSIALPRPCDVATGERLRLQPPVPALTKSDFTSNNHSFVIEYYYFLDGKNNPQKLHLASANKYVVVYGFQRADVEGYSFLVKVRKSLEPLGPGSVGKSGA